MNRLAKSFMSIPLLSCHFKRLFAQIKFKKNSVTQSNGKEDLEGHSLYKDIKELSEDIENPNLKRKSEIYSILIRGKLI